MFFFESVWLFIIEQKYNQFQVKLRGGFKQAARKIKPFQRSKTT